ncbi:restriction endonuclease subunit S [Streptomyces griseoincarnatus]|nr:hypothetical protein [Actinospica acidiphila]
MSEWRTVRFEEILSSPLRNGVSYPSKARGQGIPMVNMREIFAYDIIRDQECELVPLKERELDNFLLAEGDLLFARQSLTYEGAGRCVLVGASEGPRTWESHLIRARINRKLADPRFIYYYFRSAKGRRNIETIINQVAAAGIRGSDLKNLQVPIPPLCRQEEISILLGALDDKIAVNERIANTADELSGEIFRYAMKTSPDRFSECPLSETAQFINGRAFTKDATGTGRMVVRIAEINNGPGSSTVYNEIEVADDHLARPGDVLFAWSGSLTVARWFRPEAIINQHIFKCVPKRGNPHWLVSRLVHRKIDDFRAIAADKATTMGHIQRRHLDEPVSVPKPEELAALDRRIGPLWERALLAERESLSLAALRDTLLPPLMSGRIRVKDAEKIVEDAT